jgi:hypothetical protein
MVPEEIASFFASPGEFGKESPLIGTNCEGFKKNWCFKAMLFVH